MTDSANVQREGPPPRWEWRCFAASLAELEAKIGASAQVSSRHSEELYLANARSPHNAKIRDGLLDVKRLKAIAATGLELWEVVLQQGFPLSASTIDFFFAVLDLAPAAPCRQSYPMDAFLADVIGADPAFRTVKIAKARRVFSFCRCRTEFSRLLIDGVSQETFCIEDEMPERIEAALEKLGLNPAANTNYPKFFARLGSHEA
ncbi:hypothetical protein [Methylocystis bryophila]|uniref:CYTH domain-containing protein n=1 Tax=Methylocystis bryophila TaxID=655015 RepID=A0A1W6N098_9HYPH|nr:hypothetical protein [Methylocystis bryophila]ARN83206.1 hypothetical protein B1812_21375 [Methylocystis bryophila]BDV39547.1 hypothetical protein DSM21852_28000 [Methylocystis bryophila]